jgi:hypothetical protein
MNTLAVNTNAADSNRDDADAALVDEHVVRKFKDHIPSS